MRHTCLRSHPASFPSTGPSGSSVRPALAPSSVDPANSNARLALGYACMPSPTTLATHGTVAMLTDWVAALRPTRHKTGHFGDVPQSQSLGLVLKKLNLIQQRYAVTNQKNYNTNTNPFNSLCPGLSRWAGTRKVKPIWILLKQETVASAGPYASLHLAPDR